MADPLLATAGTIAISYDGENDSFSLSGPGFGAGTFGIGSSSLIGFTVGQTVDWSGQYVVRPLFPHPREFRGSFTVTTVPFVAGDFPSWHTFTTPFTFTGLVQRYPEVPGDPFENIEVMGSGLASLSPNRPYPNGYLNTGGSLFFTITAPAAATPEPASLLLLGSGLAAFAVRRRAKRRS